MQFIRVFTSVTLGLLVNSCSFETHHNDATSIDVIAYTGLTLPFSVCCSRYNHFVSSSGLVSSAHGRSNVHDILGLSVTLGPEVPTTSPTVGHLSIILNLLANMLSQVCS